MKSIQIVETTSISAVMQRKTLDDLFVAVEEYVERHAFHTAQRVRITVTKNTSGDYQANLDARFEVPENQELSTSKEAER